nr:immunoglobulin light chain junction region [Macaca mulatta]MPN85274.1 immunoglobulin light chain junction region [Macaca mulatta]MPN85284.1 immunoglobulin light chain junction region [Macaca mulatta]MPN85307.1 immunoglobulin light chain junction region [Macaca mulatta]MPN85357.1 immunoglobulin light chain junction region [Macaca mulatta]
CASWDDSLSSYFF